MGATGFRMINANAPRCRYAIGNDRGYAVEVALNKFDCANDCWANKMNLSYFKGSIKFVSACICFCCCNLYYI